MKKNRKQEKHSIHQRVEQFFRHRACIAAMLSFMLVGLCKSDGRLLTVMRQIYAQGFGMVGTYMREEPTRTPVDLGTNMRVTFTSGH